MKTNKIVVIGAGKLAHQLIPALQSNGMDVIQIYNRSSNSLLQLAKATQCNFTTEIIKIAPNADLYIICIKDDTIQEMASKLIAVVSSDSFVVHTSGVRPITDLNMFNNYGLLYPLHSFSKEKKQSFDSLPMITHANTKSNKNVLMEISKRISNKTYEVNDEQRKYLHLAAVLANNFTNHLLAKAFDLLKEHNIKQEILHPIIREATLKALELDPHQIQSGPAVRKDQLTIDKHLSLLDKNQLLQHIYQLMTASIQESISSNNEMIQ